MKNLKRLLLVLAITLTCNNYSLAQTPWTHYSEWMAKSRENYVYINDGKNDFWRYDDGLMYESILDTYEHYKNNGADLSGTTLLDEVKWYLKNSLTKGTEKPNNYKSSELDDVRPAKLVWKYYNTYPTDTDRDYLDNCEYVMKDIKNMKRAIPNDNTSPWEHKKSYENQVWLDGIFMCIPYYTLAGPTIGLKTNSSWTTDYIFQDAYTQIMVTDEKTYDRKTNLWKHAWDALGTRTWADCQNKELYEDFKHTAEELAKPVGTGTWQSLHTWGRALGWYVMAIMETIDNMIAYDTAHSTDHSTQINNLKILFKRVVDSYIQYRDESKGCWYCVLDVDDTKKPYSSISVKRPNYLEGTCSSMFTYALLHGVNKGYLPLSYTSLAKKAYKDLVEYFIKADGEKIKLDNCISVAGLDDGAGRRDGSFAYYMDESVIASDSKGVGPFIWASLEAEKMGYTLVKNSSNFSVNFNSLDQTGINVYKWSKVYDEIDNLSAEYTSPTFTAKTVAGTTIANSGITFNSNNPSVATVSPNGTVTLVGTGLATITATKDEMVSYYSVKVNGIQPQVETPAISITEGTNTFIGENTTVTIACDTENADIYYTTDGSEPDNTDTHYTGTFTISATTTVKAIAIKTGYDDSEIASETFTQDNTAPTLNSSTPTNKATNVATSGNITLTFDENVTIVDESKFTLSGGAGTLNTAGATVSGATVTIPYSGLANSTAYTLATEAGAVKDGSNNLNAALSNITFTTAAAAAHNASDPATTTLNGITFLDVANTTNNTTITSTNTKCVTYGLYYLGNKWKPSWKGGSTSNFDSTGDSGDFTAQGFLSSDAPASGSSNATAAATSGIGDAKIRNTDSYKHIFYVTGITGVAILNTDDKSSDNRQVYINIEEYNALGTSTTDIGTTQSTFNNSFHVTSYTAATLTADKYYKITLTGGNTSNACGKVAQIRFTQGSSSTTPTPYTVTATSNNNSWGTVSVDKATAAKGATVTITTSPASGYELTSLTATDGESNPMTITDNQFTMPASNVTVNATFAALPPVLGAVTFSPAGGNYSSEQNVTISATNAEEIWYSTVSQAEAVKNGTNATQYTSAIHIGEGSTTLYATAYLGESTTTGSATYNITIPDVGTGTELYTFSMSGSTINFANEDSKKFSITNNKSCEINNSNIKFRWHKDANTYGEFTLTSTNDIPIQSVKLVGTIEGGSQEYQDVTVTPKGTYDSETMTWTANSDNVTSVTFTNNYSTSSNGNILISKIIVVYYAPETITIAEAGFSTLYKTYAVSVGDGGTAYYVSDIRNKNVVLTPFANNIIPANTGAVIKGTFGDEVTLNRAIADEFTTTNYLLGTDTKQNITAEDNYYYFISGRQKQADNSYKYGWLVPNALKTTSVFSNNANKAYLRVPKAMLDNETSARILSLIWEDVEQPITTGLNKLNYQFVIDDKTPIYNLSGQRVSKDYKGIVIINGKKFVRK